jgi:SAM-dependent methyltransferase
MTEARVETHQIPHVPDFIVRHSHPHLRRIVEIGCGDGRFSYQLSLLLPHVEIVGIDADRDNINVARHNAEGRNLKYICANAAILAEIPCDRLIYSHSLSDADSIYAFKKLLMKTSQWLVDEGDFILRDAPRQLIRNAQVLKLLLPHWWRKSAFSAVLSGLLAELGYSHPLFSHQAGLFGWSNELYCLASRSMLPHVHAPLPVQALATEPEAWDQQPDESVLGFLFAKAGADFEELL